MKKRLAVIEYVLAGTVNTATPAKFEEIQRYFAERGERISTFRKVRKYVEAETA